MQVAVTGVFPPGLYAVRAKVHTSPWTNWQLFWIGEPDPKLAKYLPGVPYAGPVEFDLSKLSKVILIGKGQVKLVNVSDLPKLTQGTAPKTGPGVSPAGGGVVGAQVDSLAKRLATVEQQSGKDCVDCPRLRRDLDALRLQLQPGRMPATSVREAELLGREIERLEARLGPSAPGSRQRPSPRRRQGAPAPRRRPGRARRRSRRAPPARRPACPATGFRGDPARGRPRRLRRRLAALGDQGQGLRPKLQDLRRDLAARLDPQEARRRLTPSVKENDALERRLQQAPRGGLKPPPAPR